MGQTDRWEIQVDWACPKDECTDKEKGNRMEATSMDLLRVQEQEVIEEFSTVSEKIKYTLY